MAGHSRFHVADYIVFAVTIILSIGIGLFFAFRKGQNTNQEYLMGNRKMNLIPVAVSLLVSFVSTIGILGNPAEVYAYGAQFMLYIVALTIGMLMGTFVFIPLYYPLKITSVYEYTLMRFKAVHVEVFVILLAFITTVLFNAILIFTPCMAFEAVSGFPTWASMLISGLATIVYTTLGGMQAVVWTDCFQALIILAGLLAIVVKGTIEVGGVTEVWRINQEWGRVNFFEFSFDPTVRLTFWSVVVMNSILWMTIATTQQSVQRFMSLPSIRKAKMSTLIIIPGFILSGLLTCSCGVTAFAYYAKKGCDPVSVGVIRPNQIMPFFVMDILNIPSLPGLFIASLFSASISSVSSAYSAFGAVLWQNFLRKKFDHLPPKKQTNITKLATLVFGLVCIAASFLVKQMGGTIIQITYSVVGGIGGPLIGVTIVAGLFPRVGPRGVIVGAVLAIVFCVWLSVGGTLSKIYTAPLAGPTHNCTWPIPPDMTPANETLFATSQALHPVYNGTDKDMNSYEPANSGNNPMSMGTGKTGLQWMYSISYFYYPAIGIIIVTVVSLLFSLIPHLEPELAVPKKLLFPCVRPCCGLEDEVESVDMKVEGINQELEALQQAPPTEDDIWVLREDVKTPLNDRQTMTQPFYDKL